VIAQTEMKSSFLRDRELLSAKSEGDGKDGERDKTRISSTPSR
jgi:hypothetical protein